MDTKNETLVENVEIVEDIKHTEAEYQSVLDCLPFYVRDEKEKNKVHVPVCSRSCKKCWGRGYITRVEHPAAGDRSENVVCPRAKRVITHNMDSIIAEVNRREVKK
jgi:hypothetical protein